MRKIAFILCIMLSLPTLDMFSQTTENFNYQAVVRDSEGELITNQSISVQLTIIESTADGTEIFTETHSVTSSDNGLVNLLIGNGTVSLGNFSTINWSASPKFVKLEINVGSGLVDMGTFQLFSVPYALYAVDVENKDDADADVTNEIQDISLTGTDLSITSGSTVDLSLVQDGVDDADADATNEIQDISLTGTDLSITSGSTVDLSVVQDGVTDADADATNEIQDLDLTSNVLTITDNPSATPINLAAYQGTNTDEQVLSLAGTELTISGGNMVDLAPIQDGVDDADADPANEIQDISLVGTDLSITSGSTVDLSTVQDGVDDADADPANEIQDISLAGTDLSITSGSTVDLSVIQDGVDDADNNTTNELQTLTIDGDTLEISGGNQVVFPYDSSQWAVNGEKIYYNTGYVGIGSSNPVSNLEVKATAAGSKALFQVINANNDTVFAVYPDGVKIFVDSEAKGKVGGFAISGRSPSKAGEVDILRVTIDSTRFYVSDTISSKGKVGGFAISGRSPSKGVGNDYLVITGDSTRIYINDTATVKGKVGGFAISGRSPSKGPINDYLQVTRDSTRVYFSETGTKGKVGGFAISGRSPSKGTEEEYFNISSNVEAEVTSDKSKIMWFPEKNALLAGRITIPSSDSVGQNSMSLGYKNMAIGDFSQAMGYQSISRGPFSTAIGTEVVADTNSFAFGTKTKASGYNSFAFGSVEVDSLGNETSGITEASGDYSFAFGLGSQATARGSFVLGTSCLASGQFAATMGYLSESSGWAAVSMGSRNTASGDYSIAMGTNNNAVGTSAVAFGLSNNAIGYQSVVAGNGNTASGASSVAIGTENTAGGDNAFAGGRYNDCSDDASVAFGSSNTSSSANSFAVGEGTEASGLRSFSAGDNTVASGASSFAMGYQTNATNTGSFAVGNTTSSTGRYAIAAGVNTSTDAYASVVIGQYNTTFDAYEIDWLGTDPVFVVGIGTGSGSRADALRVYQDGKIYMPGVYGDLVSGGVSLYMNSSGQIGTSTSSRRYKRDITDIEDISWLYKLNPVNFIYKNDESNKKQYGLIAEDVEEVNPEFVVYNKDDEIETVTYNKLITPILKALQEQQKVIEQQAKENASLQDQINDLKNRLMQLEK
ncbi:tail fiber domain-containing protein [Bacteroidota bacterium]